MKENNGERFNESMATDNTNEAVSNVNEVPAITNEINDRPIVSQNKKIICKKCGYELQDDFSLCPKCGHKIKSNNKKNIILLIIACIVIALATTACIFIFRKKDVPATVDKAETVDFYDIGGYFARSYEWCEIAADGSYMKVDTGVLNKSKESSEAFETILKFNSELGFPQSLNEKMLNTRALDGRLSEENEKIRVSWTYHPNNGLEVIYEKKYI